jgi:hypothetical protein
LLYSHHEFLRAHGEAIHAKSKDLTQRWLEQQYEVTRKPAYERKVSFEVRITLMYLGRVK